MTDRRCVTTNGKEVLLDGKHFADGVSEDAARCIADALEFAGLIGERWPQEARDRIARLFG